MNNLIKTLLVAGCIFGTVATTVRAQPTIIILTENGIGSSWFPPGAPGPAPLPFTVGPDPSAGVAGPVLIYTVPGPPLVLGDLLLFENANTRSDVVRFWTGNQVIFY